MRTPATRARRVCATEQRGLCLLTNDLSRALKQHIVNRLTHPLPTTYKLLQKIFLSFPLAEDQEFLLEDSSEDPGDKLHELSSSILFVQKTYKTKKHTNICTRKFSISFFQKIYCGSPGLADRVLSNLKSTIQCCV